METETFQKTIHLSDINLPMPANINLALNTTHNLSKALELYLEKHPEVITQILTISAQIAESLKTTPPTKTAGEKRRDMQATLKNLGEDDLEWLDEVPKRVEKAKKRPPVFFE